MKYAWKATKILMPTQPGQPPIVDPMFKPRTGEVEGRIYDDALAKVRAGDIDLPDGVKVRSAVSGPDGFVVYLEEDLKPAKKKPARKRKAPRA